MEWWQTLLVALIPAAVPTVLLFVLQRRGANKQLQLQEGNLDVATFEAQRAAYKDLYDTTVKQLGDANDRAEAANALSESLAEELRTYKKERETLMAQIEEQGRKIQKLEESATDQADELADTRDKLVALRALFEEYVARTGVPLTPEEEARFEQTKPKWLIQQELKEGNQK